jgi:hypothetical protein
LIYIINSNILVALAGSILAFGLMEQRLTTLSIEFPFFIFFAIYSVYNFQRLYKYRSTSTPNHLTDWFATHKNKLIYSTLISAFIALILLIFSERTSTHLLFLLVISGIFSLWYVFPILKRELRDIPYIKAPVVAVVWTIMLVYVPLSGSVIQFHESLLFFCYFLALAIPFDIRDHEFDKSHQKTIPQVFGVNGAKAISISLFVIFYSSFYYLFPYRYFNFLFWISFLMVVLLILGIRKDRSIYYFSMIDASMILLGLSFYLDSIK